VTRITTTNPELADAALYNHITIFEDLFEAVFSDLAKIYDGPSFNSRHYFVTLCDQSMTTKAINIEAFQPSLETPKQIAGIISGLLKHYLQSHQELKLNNSFRLYIVVYR
jgi:hypothetical protein